jgi:CelD/BcsL family acetyltransferase involved in cellulose biosynthesis
LLNASLIDPASDPRWLPFLESDACASIFHHPAWLKLLSDTYGYEPVCIIADDGGRVAGVLPLMEVRSWLTGRRAVCLPFSDTCGPIARDDAAHRALIEFGEGLGKERGWRYLEIRNSIIPGGFAPSARYKLHVTELARDPEAVLKTFNQHSRRKLRKAEASRVRVEHRVDDEALRAFIRLNALTRRKHGVLPQPDSLFLNIQKGLLEAGLGFLGVATLDNEDEVVAANLFLHWNGTVVYKYGASAERASPVAANYAVMWDAIRWGCEQGYSRFDFGRSDLDGEGLLQFKRGWGSREIDLVYARRSSTTPRAEPSSEPGLQERLKPVISKMPVSLLKIIGGCAYPHVG